MKKCPNCGAVWPDSEYFCQNCGEVLPQAQPEPSAPLQVPEHFTLGTPAGAPNPTKAGGKKHLTLIIVIIAAAAAAIIGVMFYLNYKNDQYDKQINLGNQYFANRQYDKAIKAYNAASRIKPDAPRPYEGKAQVYLAQKKYDQAAKALDATDENNWTASTQVTYANIKRIQGNSAESVSKYYKKALSLIPGEVKQTKDKSERKDILNLYQEIFETLEPTDTQIKTATETIEAYGDDDMLMGVTNNNAIIRRAVALEMDSQTEGGSFATVGSDTYHLFENKLLKDDADGNTTTVYRFTYDSEKGLGNLNYYMGYFYFTYGNQFIMNGSTISVYRVRPDGTGLTKIASSRYSDATTSELMVYDGRIYFSYYRSAMAGGGNAKSVLTSYDLNGGDRTTLSSLSGDDASWMFGIDGGHLYLPDGDEVIDFDLEDNSKTTISLGSYDIYDYGYASNFTIDDGVLYGISHDEDYYSRATVFSFNLKTEEKKVVKRFAQNYLAVDEFFVKNGKCYYLVGESHDDGALPYSLEIRDNDNDTLIESDDYYRAALMDGEIWVEDSDGDMHYYKLSDDQTEDVSANDSNLIKKTGSKSAKLTAAKRSYREIVEEVADDNEYQPYALFDLNRDGTPELIIDRGTCEADNVHYFYTYKNGEAVQIGREAGRHSSYYGENGNSGNLISVMGHMGYEYDDRWTYDGKTFKAKTIRENEYEDADDDSIYKNNNPVKQYEVTDLTPLE